MEHNIVVHLGLGTEDVRVRQLHNIECHLITPEFENAMWHLVWHVMWHILLFT